MKKPINRRAFVLGTAATAVAAAAVAEGCSSAGSFFRGSGPSASSYELYVGYAQTTIAGYDVSLRNYNGATAGPTLDAYPGTTLAIRVTNNLPPNPPATVPQGAVRIPAHSGNSMAMGQRRTQATKLSAPVIDPMNNPHLFNTTNLHVHGIQTVPHLFDPIGTSNPAAMMLAIAPYGSFQYDFPIPADQPPGLYWYHPHHHGSTDVQVSSGMAGLIVVHGSIDQVPEIAAARDIRMAVQTLGFNQSVTNPNLYNYEPIAYQTAANGGYNLGPNINVFTVNGHAVNVLNNTTGDYSPLPLYQLAMQPGEVIRLRMLNGTNCFNLPLVLPGCEMYVIGYDGVNLSAPVQVVHNDVAPISTADRVAGTVAFTTSGSRIELLIRAPLTPGTYTLSSVGTIDINYQAFPQIDLANIVVSGTPVSMNIPASLPLPTREYPAIADSEIVNKRTIIFSEGATDVLLTGYGFFIDNRLYGEMDINYTVKSGTAEEWTIQNTSGDPHPFHLHENSFEVTNINGTPGSYGIHDTFLVPKMEAVNGSITIRVRFKGPVGKTVFHCHILPHEDTGMMQNLLMT